MRYLKALLMACGRRSQAPALYLLKALLMLCLNGPLMVSTRRGQAPVPYLQKALLEVFARSAVLRLCVTKETGTQEANKALEQPKEGTGQTALTRTGTL